MVLNVPDAINVLERLWRRQLSPMSGTLRLRRHRVGQRLSFHGAKRRFRLVGFVGEMVWAAAEYLRPPSDGNQ